MRYLKILLAILGLTTVLTSCEFREKIIFEKDGSGIVATSFYGEQMGGMLESFSPDSSDGIVKLRVEDLIKENQEDLDKLSKEEKQEIYAMSSTEITIENQEGDLLVSMEIPFKNIDEVNSIIKRSRASINRQFNKNKDSTEVKESTEAALADLVEVDFYWKNNVFERTTSIKDTLKYSELVKSVKFSSSSFAENVFSYVLVYSFPKKIHSFSPEDATLSGDRKTITLRRSAMQVTKDPKLLDLKLTF